MMGSKRSFLISSSHSVFQTIVHLGRRKPVLDFMFCSLESYPNTYLKVLHSVIVVFSWTDQVYARMYLHTLALVNTVAVVALVRHSYER